jgi:6-phospho-beta-glucosidase
VILEVANDIEKFAPSALLVNFANPSGLVTEALFRYAPGVTSVGVCNSALTTKMEMLEIINERLGTNFSPSEARIQTLGLNHLTWYSGFEIQGHDYWPEIIAEPINQMRDQEDPYFDPHTLEKLQMLPNSYLRYYYNTHKMLEKQESWPPSRAEEVMEIERDLLESYKDETLAEPPENLMKRGGAYYSTVAAQLLNAHYNDLDEVHIVNTQNNGAVPSWDRDWVLEMPCRINAKGVFPVPTSPLPQECESLIQTVKAYEILTAQAAVEGDRDAAYKALLVHPLGPSADKITTVLDVMLETNRRYLPNFFKE